MITAAQVPEVVQRKLEAFESIQAEFEKCFQFEQDVHGQKRFSSFPVGQVVTYLHALWVCERKDRLLSIYKNIRRYEGQRCLELLRGWQEGQSADVVAFLTRKLDMFPFATITTQIEVAHNQHGNEALEQRLENGRRIALNRGMNLLRALEAIFSLSQNDLLSEVRPACEQSGHTPVQIEAQLTEMEAPLYAYRPHQLLAQRNMVVMNKLEMDVLASGDDQFGERFWRVNPSTEPSAPFANHLIDGYFPLLAPLHNNVQQVRFIDRAEPERDTSL